MVDFDGSKELIYDFPKEFQIKQNGKAYKYYKLANNKIRFMDEVPQAGALDIVEVLSKQTPMKPTLCHTIADLAFMTKDDVERIDDTASRLKTQSDDLAQTLKVSQDLMQDITEYENKNKADIEFLKADTANGLIGLAKGLDDTNTKIDAINTRTISDAESLGTKISDHERANNPHKITKRTIGLEKVDNTPDVDKPISKAVQKELDKKADKKALADIEKKLEKTGKKQEEIINGLSSFGAAAAQSQGGGASSFSELEGSPYDNSALKSALDSKANKSSIPVVDQTYDGTSTNAQSGVAVKSAIDSIEKTYRGVYDASVQYYTGDIVKDGEFFFVAKSDTLGNATNLPAYWATISNDYAVRYFEQTDNVEYPIGCTANGVSGNGYTGSMNFTTTNSPTINASTGALTAPVLKTTTQSQGDNSTNAATTEYVDTAVHKTFTGADGVNAGLIGAVPAPSATDNTKFLRGDGTWGEAGGGEDPNAVHFLSGASDPTTSTQGNVGDIYNNTNDNTKWILNSITKAENYTKKEDAGAITISADYIASGFKYSLQYGSPKYSCLVSNTALFNGISSNTWEFCSKVNMSSFVSGNWNDVLGGAAGTYLPDLFIDADGYIAMNLSSTGSGYDITNGEDVTKGTTVLSTNTWYWVKYGWDGTTYYAEFSTDGTNYTREIALTSSTPIAGSLSNPYIGARIGHYFSGSIDLKETYFKIDGSITWSALSDVYNWQLIETVLKGTSAPSSSTAGYVGQIYVDYNSYTPAAYICVSADRQHWSFNWYKITP